MASNELRMPFAEWLFRMSKAELAPQARELAIYAVVFKVSTNEELATLSGMDTKIAGKSVADKTYNRWKKLLTDDGWVILKAVTKGRVTTIEVFPAFGSEPVTFTDIKSRDVRKFYERNDQSKSYVSEVEDTDETEVPAVEVTDETRKSYTPAVEPTAVSCAPAPALMESLRDSYTFESEVKFPLGSPTVDDEHRAAYEAGQRLKQGLTAKSARAQQRTKGELDGSHGIEFSGGKLTVTNGAHAKLAEDFPGIDIEAVCDRAGPEITRMRHPTADDAMSVLRKWARIVMEEFHKVGRPRTPQPKESELERMQRLMTSGKSMDQRRLIT